jgi:hypothetical protein
MATKEQEGHCGHKPMLVMKQHRIDPMLCHHPEAEPLHAARWLCSRCGEAFDGENPSDPNPEEDDSVASDEEVS